MQGGKGAASRNSRHRHLMTKQEKPATISASALSRPDSDRDNIKDGKSLMDENIFSKQAFFSVEISCTLFLLPLLLRIWCFEVITYPFHFQKDELSSTDRAKDSTNSSKHPYKLRG